MNDINQVLDTIHSIISKHKEIETVSEKSWHSIDDKPPTIHFDLRICDQRMDLTIHGEHHYMELKPRNHLYYVDFKGKLFKNEVQSAETLMKEISDKLTPNSVRFINDPN